MDLFSVEACCELERRQKFPQPPACRANPIWSIRKLSLFMICYIIKTAEAGEVRIWRAEYDVRLMMFQLKIDNLHDVMFTLLRFATNKGQVGVGRMMEMLWRERTFDALSAQMKDFVDGGWFVNGVFRSVFKLQELKNFLTPCFLRFQTAF